MNNLKRMNILKMFIIIAFTSFAISGCVSNNLASNNEKNDIALKLEEFMLAYNENCSYKYSGTILVAKGNNILLNEGYGMANYEEKIPNKSDSVFAIGSITKSFTATSIMQLQEQGLLNINDPISKYIEGNKRGDDITIHHLLTHTAGFPVDGLYLGKVEVPLDKDINYLNNCTYLFEPGGDFLYSNAGYQMLAAIIEKVSGKTYNDYLKDNIFIPLGMNNSRGGTDCSYADNQSIGYSITTVKPERLSIYNFSCITGSGNIYSTVEDLYKYERAIQDRTLLKEESINTIFISHWGDSKNGYGYGWETTERNGHKKFTHGGNIGGGGYVSTIIRYPEDDYVLIFLTNNLDYTALTTVTDTMEAIIFGENFVTPQKSKDIKIDSEVLKQYAGEYDFGRSTLIPVSYKDGRLYTIADDGNNYELYPLSETKFYYDEHECIQVEFTINKDNRVTLNIQNASRNFEGKKQ